MRLYLVYQTLNIISCVVGIHNEEYEITYLMKTILSVNCYNNV